MFAKLACSSLSDRVLIVTPPAYQLLLGSLVNERYILWHLQDREVLLNHTIKGRKIITPKPGIFASSCQKDTTTRESYPDPNASQPSSMQAPTSMPARRAND
jgi:hypothetical protein